MKSSSIKKIISIVIISLVLAITVTTIVLALVPKKLYNPIASGYSYITIYQKDASEPNTYTVKDHKDVIENVDKYLEKSIRDNVLSSIFQGTGSFEYGVNIVKTTNVISSVASSSENTCIVYGYLEEQVLKINGETYKNPESTTTNKEVNFNRLVMLVENNADFQECTVYVLDDGDNSNYQIKFLAHQSDLYNYIESLEW